MISYKKEDVVEHVKKMKALFSHQIEEDRLTTNPVKRKHILRCEDKEMSVWTPLECKQFLDYANKIYSINHREVFIMYKIASNCGMRWGEIAALQTEDIDFDHSRIRINKSYCQVGSYIKLPKSGKVRFATLSPSLAQDLREYILQKGIKGVLFKDTTGNYYSYNTFRNVHWLKDVRESGVRYIKFHNLRRFYCISFIENGGNEVTLRKLVGHQDQRMTDLYTTMREDYTELAQIVNI